MNEFFISGEIAAPCACTLGLHAIIYECGEDFLVDWIRIEPKSAHQLWNFFDVLLDEVRQLDDNLDIRDLHAFFNNFLDRMVLEQRGLFIRHNCVY